MEVKFAPPSIGERMDTLTYNLPSYLTYILSYLWVGVMTALLYRKCEGPTMIFGLLAIVIVWPFVWLFVILEWGFREI